MEIKVDKIIKSKRRTIALEISKNAELIVRVPRTTTMSEIKEVLIRNSEWINTKLTTAKSKITQIKHCEFEEGDFLEILGEIYFINFIKFQSKLSRPKINFETKQIYINDGKESEEPREHRKEQLIKLCKKAAKSIFLERMNRIAEETGFRFKSLKVTSSTTRWGSCSPDNKINLTWRLLLAKPHQLDYVIIHELAHTIQKDHSAKFWAIVERHLPNYKKTMKEFKEYGHHYTIN